MSHSFQPTPRAASRLLWLALAVLLAWLGTTPAQAQLDVNLQITRRIYMLNEPLLATVIIHNLSGQDVMLADTQEGGQWLSIQIVDNDGRFIPPRNPKYEVEPLPIRAGETMKRTLNLNELYSLGDFGAYKVHASVFFPPTGKFISSRNHLIELTEGLRIWKETVGAPGGGGYRTFSLLTLEEEGKKMLYVRLAGVDDGIVYGCYCLGHILDNFPPQAILDSGNNLAVLQLVGQKAYLLSRIGVDGAFLGQTNYVTPKSQPYLRKTAGGALQIVGAVRPEVIAQAAAAAGPKLSDRPKGF
jgi:hypothetical protein